MTTNFLPLLPLSKIPSLFLFSSLLPLGSILVIPPHSSTATIGLFALIPFLIRFYFPGDVAIPALRSSGRHGALGSQGGVSDRCCTPETNGVHIYLSTLDIHSVYKISMHQTIQMHSYGAHTRLLPLKHSQHSERLGMSPMDV